MNYMNVVNVYDPLKRVDAEMQDAICKKYTAQISERDAEKRLHSLLNSYTIKETTIEILAQKY